MQDPYPFYARARALGPLFFWEDYGFPCAAGYDAVNALLRDRRFGRELPDDLKPPRPASLRRFYELDDASMLNVEPPAHTRLRRLTLRAFTSRRIAGLAPEIEALAHRLIDRLPADGFDLLPAFGETLPLTVIARLLGAPEEEARNLLGWSHDMVAVYQARRDAEVEARAEAAAVAFSDFVAALIDSRRRATRDDLLSELIAAEEDGVRLGRDEMIATAILLLNAGHEATVHAIGNGVRALLMSDFDPAEVFATEPTASAAVEEILRFDAPLHLFTRYALSDVEAFGHRFARGDTVGCLLAAANRDPARFGAPEEFRPHRAPLANLGFGAGVHFCIGAPLARLELTIGLHALFSRLPALRLAQESRFADRYHFRGLEALRLSPA